MRKMISRAALLSVALVAAVAISGGSARAEKLSTDSQMGTLVDDPGAKAVLVKHIPDIVSNPQMEQARGMSLKSLQQYAPDQLTDAKLKQIDDDLAKLPAK